jgi:hypothetical protein
MIWEYKTGELIAKHMGKLLGEDINYPVEFEMYRYQDKIGFRLNFSVDIDGRKVLQNPSTIFDEYRNFKTALKNSEITREFREKIEQLENENTELQNKLSRKDSVIHDLLEDSGEIEVNL